MVLQFFFAIMGVFLYDENSYSNKLKKLFKRLVLPCFIVSIIYYLFYEYIAGISNLKESIYHTKYENFIILKNMLLTLSPAVPYTAHLWYIYTYIIIILIYPILNKIRELIDTLDYKKVLLILFLVLLYNDLSCNAIFNFQHNNISSVLGGIFFVFLGYLIYKNKNNILNKRHILKFSILIIILVCFIRTFISFEIFNLYEMNIKIFRWNTSFSFINSICLIIICLKISSSIKNLKFKGIINNVGSLTFYGYLIHIIVIGFCDNLGIRNYITNITNVFQYRIVINQIIYTIVIFSFSIFISFVLMMLISRIKKKI